MILLILILDSCLSWIVRIIHNSVAFFDRGYLPCCLETTAVGLVGHQA